jgi:hypothetical protein
MFALLIFNPPPMNTIPNISISPASSTNYPWEEALEDEGSEPKMSTSEIPHRNTHEGKLQQIAIQYVSDLRDAIHHLTPEQLVSMVEEMDESEMN